VEESFSVPLIAKLIHIARDMAELLDKARSEATALDRLARAAALEDEEDAPAASTPFQDPK
jgi:hypothetical protein